MKHILSLVTLALSLGVLAQDEPRTEAGEVRLQVTNALIQEVKGGRSLSMRLKWDYLPESVAFKKNNSEIFEFTGSPGAALSGELRLANEDLRTPERLETWYDKLPDAKRKLLSLALSAGQSDNETSLTSALALGDSYYSKPLLEQLGWSPGTQTVNVPWFPYITSRRDHFAMRWLLAETRGAGATVDFAPAPRGKNPMALYKGLQWTIKIVPTRDKNPFFRFAVSVETGEIRRTFRKGDDGPVDSGELTVKVGLLKEKKLENAAYLEMIPISIGSNGVPFSTSPLEGASDLEPIESDLSPSVGSVLLKSLTGSGADGLLAPLFANASEASLFYGTLLGSGPGATTYGLNYIFTDNRDGNLGFLYGFVPERDNSLFIGPSLMFGPFTAAVGGRVFNRDDESVTASLAGVLSIDLARAFGQGPKPTAVKPEMQNTSSEVWRDVDSLYRGSMLSVNWFLQPIAGQGLATRVTVRQRFDLANEEPENPYVDSILTLKLDQTAEGQMQLLMLPKGTYTIEAPPDGMVTLTSGTLDPISDIPADEYSAEQWVNMTAGIELVPVRKFYVRLRGYQVLVKLNGLPSGGSVKATRIEAPMENSPSVVKVVRPSEPLWLPAGKYRLQASQGLLWKTGDATAEEIEVTVPDPLADDAPPDLDKPVEFELTLVSP